MKKTLLLILVPGCLLLLLCLRLTSTRQTEVTQASIPPTENTLEWWNQQCLANPDFKLCCSRDPKVLGQACFDVGQRMKANRQ